MMTLFSRSLVFGFARRLNVEISVYGFRDGWELVGLDSRREIKGVWSPFCGCPFSTNDVESIAFKIIESGTWG
jgi:hypothetical protein